MKFGFIGLGKMGSSMVKRLCDGGHGAVVYDNDADILKSFDNSQIIKAKSLQDLIEILPAPRLVWIMVPSGNPVEQVIQDIIPFLKNGDIIIDGGNSNYRDTMRRSEYCATKGIHMLDVGTSGGIGGHKDGYCLMVGGEKKVFDIAKPVFETLSAPEGCQLVGPSGSGHFVKMIHNGIEYAILQAYGEGFEILNAKDEFKLDCAQIAGLWNRGSVIRSWILELAQSAFKRDPYMTSIKGYVEDSGEGRWTVAEAIDNNIPAPIITLSLLQRFSSRQDDSFSARVIASLRKEFGGHGVKTNNL